MPNNLNIKHTIKKLCPKEGDILFIHCRGLDAAELDLLREKMDDLGLQVVITNFDISVKRVNFKDIWIAQIEHNRYRLLSIEDKTSLENHIQGSIHTVHENILNTEYANYLCSLLKGSGIKFKSVREWINDSKTKRNSVDRYKILTKGEVQ